MNGTKDKNYLLKLINVPALINAACLIYKNYVVLTHMQFVSLDEHSSFLEQILSFNC